jgi:hypothetical protein
LGLLGHALLDGLSDYLRQGREAVTIKSDVAVKMNRLYFFILQVGVSGLFL